MELNKTEWPYFVIGTLHTIISEALQLIFSVIISGITGGSIKQRSKKSSLYALPFVIIAWLPAW